MLAEVRGPEFSRDNTPFMLENFFEVGNEECAGWQHSIEEDGTKEEQFLPKLQ